jgi:peroxiredoxin Q/BCP
MPLSIGEIAPDFQLASTSGSDFSFLHEAQGKPIVLYFYPKDFTDTCTAQACEFNDNISWFNELGVLVVGISKDDLPTHYRFKEKYKLSFELLADEKGQVAKLYKATVPIIGLTRRITYLIDADRKIIGVYEDMFEAKGHIKYAIEKLQKNI